MKEISQYALPAHLTDSPIQEARPRNVIGKDDFMKLLMVQLQNQDPLKPMDHEQFSAQLAQFSSLEQLTNIGKGIDKLHGGMGEEQKLQALGMIGRKVTAQGNELNLIEGQSVTLNYSLPENVQPIRAYIADGSGNVVRELSVDGRADGPADGKGAHSALTWDGKSQEGVRLPSAKYTFRVAGVDQNGVPHEAGAELSGTVTGVELDGKSAILVVKNGASQSRIEMAKVRQVAIDSAPMARPEPAVKLSQPLAKNEDSNAAPIPVEATNPGDESAADETESFGDDPDFGGRFGGRGFGSGDSGLPIGRSNPMGGYRR